MKNILEYQKIDARLRKLNNDLMQSEERKKLTARKKFLLQVDEMVTKLDKKAQDLTAKFADINNIYASKKSELKQFQGITSTLESHTEIDYLLKRVEKLQGEVKGIESEILTLSDEIESTLKEFNEIRAKNKIAKEEYARYKDVYNEMKEKARPEMEEIQSQLQQMEREIDPKILEKYKYKRDMKIFPVFVKANGSICGGCSMEIPLKHIKELEEKGIVECDECKRFIYYER